MIKSIRINNFKKIQNLDLRLDRMNVLVGPNNSGKSSVLQAIQFGISALQSVDLSPTSSRKTATWRNDSKTSSIAAHELIYSPVHDPYDLGRSQHFSQSHGIECIFTESSGASCSIEIKKGKNRNLAVSAKGEELGQKLESISEMYSAMATGLAGIASVEEYKTPGVVRKAAARGDSNNYFRNILWQLWELDEEYEDFDEEEDTDDREQCGNLNDSTIDDTADYAESDEDKVHDNSEHSPIDAEESETDDDELSEWYKFSSRLEEIFPGLSLTCDFDFNNSEHIQVTATFGDADMPIELCGTGVLQTVQILAYIGLYSPRLLILDEPDSHLHPDNQRRLFEVLDRVSQEESFQVLMCTHSRNLLDAAIGLDANVRWISNGQFQSEEHDLVQGLMDLGALDAVDRLGGKNKKLVIFTEDSTNLTRFEPIAEANGWKNTDYEVFSYDSSGQSKGLKTLVRFSHDRFPSLKLLVYRDRDYVQQEIDELRGLITEEGGFFLTSPGYDMESFFLQRDHLRAVAPDNVDVDQLLDQSLDEAKERSIDKLTNVIFNNQAKFNLIKPGKERGRNAAKAARKAKSFIEQDPARWCVGKLTYRAMKNIYQRQYPGQPPLDDWLFQSSDSLRMQDFPKTSR